MVHAEAELEITPLTWNIIGLDSNDETVGPNRFPVGARVCNIGDTTATNVTSSFEWTSPNAYVDFRPGTKSAFSDPGLDLTAGECTDFYYEIEVDRTDAAREATRSYKIHAAADGGVSARTPDDRELFVEHLISQSRNSVVDVKLDSVSVPFVYLKNLRGGDEIIVHAFGSQYVYQVQTRRYALPQHTSVLADSVYSMLTLITCSGYNEALDAYRFRVVVQAVLVEID